VKQILMSSATDLGAPAVEQGAGRIDGLAAVQMALSVPDENGFPRPAGTGLLASPSSASITAPVGQDQLASFIVTNTGAKTVRVSPALEGLGAPIAGETVTVQLNPASDPTFTNVLGAKRPYAKQTFVVPAGADHLDAAIALPPTTASGKQTIGALALIDPSGRQAAYSIPQGVGSGYQHVDVTKPAAGTWTAIIRTTPPSVSSSYTGPVQLTWSAERYTSLGTVFPPRLTLAPGESAWIIADVTAPAQPGDTAAAIRFHGSAGAAMSEIPISVRALVPTGPRGGTFTATLTGGNGRAGATPTSTYAFDVPFGVSDMSFELDAPDSAYQVTGYLVDPNGMALGSASNVDLQGNRLGAIEIFRTNPQPGRWRFVLDEVLTSGKATTGQVTGRIGFGTASVKAPALPRNRHNKLSAGGAPLAVPVAVTNTGAAPKAYFADARLDGVTDVTLAVNACSATTTLPGLCQYAIVPPQANHLRFTAQASVPVTLDASWATGQDPEVYGHPIGNGTVAASIGAPEVPFGAWYVVPALVGPFGATGAATAPVTTTATASMHPFDPAVAADSGNLWADATNGTSTFNPLVLAPGASGTITLTITPDAKQVGQVVSGTVTIATYNGADNYGSGDEVATLPYAYTVAQ
jgi:hypothetical protein